MSVPGSGVVAAVIDARRDQLYLQAFQDGVPVMEPSVLTRAEAAVRLGDLHAGGPAAATGPGAALLGGRIADARLDEAAFPDLAALGRLAAARTAPTALPRPLYLRAPDARTLAERSAGP
jgi:tRNA threonylcarbamoyladenosine biosynthesis protein TsaB